MLHYLYEKDNQGRVANFVEAFDNLGAAIEKAEKLTAQWAAAGVERHYLISFRDIHEWEN